MPIISNLSLDQANYKFIHPLRKKLPQKKFDDPFRWWSRRWKFKAADVESIEEGAVYTGLRDIPRPVIFFGSGRKDLMLDLTANKIKRNHLWSWLIVIVERGNAE